VTGSDPFLWITGAVAVPAGAIASIMLVRAVP